MYKRKGVGKQHLVGEEKELLLERNYLKNGEIHMEIDLSKYMNDKYIPIIIRATEYVCPKEDGMGNDERKLAWILNRIY